MNKKLRVGLILLIAAVLALSLTIPGLAKKDKNVACIAIVLTVDGSGDFHRNYIVFGDLEAYWDEGVLYNYCTGNVPIGEQISPAVRFATFEEACEYFNVTCENGVLVLTPDNWTSPVYIFDPEDPGWEGFATDWRVDFWENGEFLFYKEYTP